MQLASLSRKRKETPSPPTTLAASGDLDIRNQTECSSSTSYAWKFLVGLLIDHDIRGYCTRVIGRRCGSVGSSLWLTTPVVFSFVTYHSAYGRMGGFATFAIQWLAEFLFQTKVSGIFSSFRRGSTHLGGGPGCFGYSSHG